MNTRDKNTETGAASEMMLPDSTMHPADPSLMKAAAEGPFTTAAAAAPATQTRVTRSPFQESMQRFLRDKRSMISLGILIFLFLISIVGPPIYQHIGGLYQDSDGNMVGPVVYHNPFHHDIDHQDEGPSKLFWLGTDSIGYDLLARMMQSLLVSISVALIVEVIDITFGIGIGVLAGYYGGWIDQFLARFTDIMFAFPGILFAILLSGVLGPTTDAAFSKIPLIGTNGNTRLVLVSVALAFTAWPIMARYVRGQTLQIKEQQFIEAARTSGTSNFKIIMRHIIPNLFSIVIVASTLNIANTIVGEAGLSLLGLGVRSPGSSLGLMISDNVAAMDTSHPWEILFPCIVLAIIVLAFSFLGDGLRDAFDPRSKD